MASLFKNPTSTPLRSPGTENLLHPDNMNPDEQQHESLSSPLCQRCKSIDLQDFFSGASAGTDRIFHVFEPPHHLRPSECPLCCAIAFIRPDISENHVYHLVQAQTDLEGAGNRLTIWRPGNSKVQICTPHTGRNFGTDCWSGDLSIPSLPGGLGFTFDLHPCEKSALNLPGKIDFDVVKGWIHKCKKYHDEECELVSGMSNIPNLRLIDCATRKIGPFQEGDIYAALSYCWGASQASQADEPGTPFKLPQHLPATIEDAILVTQNLGIKCIWIDRYCVPQGAEDPGRHEQIALMHKIYMGAEVTLIAAAGDSPTYGLPGVTKDRTLPPRIKFGSHTLAATLPDPRILIASSIWWTRGWTYQEGLLSRRRLVFTDQQMYFQCNNHIVGPAPKPCIYYGWSEVMSLASANIICSRNIPEYSDGFFRFGLSPWEIWPRISEYTQRSLSHQEDILNAMLGILEKYAELKWFQSTFWHIFGIPGSHPVNLKDKSWYDVFLRNLTWELPTPGKRREGFPSWSWAGWEGKGFVGRDDCVTPLLDQEERHVAVIHLEQEEGIPAADMDRTIQKVPNIVTHWKIPRIIFECLSVSLQIKKLSQCYSTSPYRRFAPPENKLDLRVVMQSGEILHAYNFQLLPRDLAEDPGLEKGIPCVGLLLDPPKRLSVELSNDPENLWKLRRTCGCNHDWGVVVLLVMESHQRTGPEKTGKLYERIGKTVIPDEHLRGVSEKRGHFTIC